MRFTTVTRSAAALFLAALLTGCSGALAAAPSPSPTFPTVPTVEPRPLPTATPGRTPSPSPVPTPEPSPDPSADPTPTPAPAEESYCNVADVATPNVGFDEHAQTYLDWTYRLPADYVPPDLVNANTGTPTAGARLTIRALAYGDLARLRAAALAAGHRLDVVSAYRSHEEQARTFDYWTRVGGYEQALRTSARPGHSEHQLGTAIDFGDGTAAPWEYADWAQTPTGAWLASHAADFGFVMSYPKGRSAVTCYSYEPWHYRYVGTELAKTLVASGLSLREFQLIS